MTKKESLKQEVKELYYDPVINNYQEFAEFCETEILNIIPFLNNDGLIYLKQRLLSIKKQEER